MTEIDLLEQILAKTARVVDGVRADQLGDPTPCSDFDVEQLRNHIVGWAQVFAAGSAQHPFDGDPAIYTVGDDAGSVFRSASAEMVRGWREHGFDREVRLMGAPSPAPMVFTMTLMEYLTHGWDLATATGQPIPYSDEEAFDVLRRAEGTLKDEYRGAAFGPRVEVASDAPAVDRLVAFMGRRP